MIDNCSMDGAIPFPSKPKGNRLYATDDLLCEVCWRVIKNPANAYSVVADSSISFLLPLSPLQEPNGGTFLIGPECAKEIPKTHKSKGWKI